jgi:hypothetical protein
LGARIHGRKVDYPPFSDCHEVDTSRYNSAMNNQASDDKIRALRRQLNSETGRIGWQPLQRPFARGVLLKVAMDMDLVEVAARITADDGETVRDWLASGSLARATAEDALDWQSRQPVFWAVVTAPWVLVQEAGEPA